MQSGVGGKHAHAQATPPQHHAAMLDKRQSTRKILGSFLRQSSGRGMEKEGLNERIAAWISTKAVWVPSKVESREPDVAVEGGLVRLAGTRTSVVQYKVAMSREHPYFEVLLLHGAASKDRECAVSVGIAGADYWKSESHVGLKEGSVGWHVSTGALHVGRERSGAGGHALYCTAECGDIVGCGVLYTEGGLAKDGRPLCVFWTKNGAVVGSVTVATWKKLKAPLYASVGLHGEGTRVVTFSSVVPPLLEVDEW